MVHQGIRQVGVVWHISGLYSVLLLWIPFPCSLFRTDRLFDFLLFYVLIILFFMWQLTPCSSLFWVFLYSVGRHVLGHRYVVSLYFVVHPLNLYYVSVLLSDPPSIDIFVGPSGNVILRFCAICLFVMHAIARFLLPSIRGHCNLQYHGHVLNSK